MSDLLPLSIPSIKGNEWKYVKECLDTEWVSSAGKYVSMFEEEICNYTGSEYAVACMNGTAALQVALHLVGVQANDEVIVPSLTFIAPVNTVAYLNAYPVFMDCDEFYNLDMDKVIQFIKNDTDFRAGYTYNKKSGRKITAIIPVHIFGNACNLEKIMLICRERNIAVIEDATESLGTQYIDGKLAGKYTGGIGDIGCYSFNGNKIITTGGGGMMVTNNAKYSEKARYLTTQAKDDPIRYIHNEIGYNFRMTNIQAALGVAQLEQLPEYIRIKTNNFKKYKTEIDKINGLKLADAPSYAKSNYWFYAMQIDEKIYDKNREELMKYLADNNIQSRPIWHLNHLQEPYKNCQSYKIEKAFDLLKKTLNIPCSVSLQDEDIERVVKILNG